MGKKKIYFAMGIAFLAKFLLNIYCKVNLPTLRKHNFNTQKDIMSLIQRTTNEIHMQLYFVVVLNSMPDIETIYNRSVEGNEYIFDSSHIIGSGTRFVVMHVHLLILE